MDAERTQKKGELAALLVGRGMELEQVADYFRALEAVSKAMRNTDAERQERFDSLIEFQLAEERRVKSDRDNDDPV